MKRVSKLHQVKACAVAIMITAVMFFSIQTAAAVDPPEHQKSLVFGVSEVPSAKTCLERYKRQIPRYDRL